jgi:hypothetical protein
LLHFLAVLILLLPLLGVKNHHLKSASTPQQFFTQLVFSGLQPFFWARAPFYKPYALLKVQPNYQSQLNGSKALVGLASVQSPNRG